jgi:hypothetical protein
MEHTLAGGVAGAERINVHAVAARRAAAYDRRAAGDHLARALDIEPTPAGSEWAERITCAPGHLDAIVGFAGYALGHPGADARLLRAVHALDARRGRTRARCHARLAGLAVLGGDDDAAAAHVDQALKSKRSVLVSTDLHTFAALARQANQHALAELAGQAHRP